MKKIIIAAVATGGVLLTGCTAAKPPAPTLESVKGYHAPDGRNTSRVSDADKAAIAARLITADMSQRDKAAICQQIADEPVLAKAYFLDAYDAYQTGVSGSMAWGSFVGEVCT